MGALEGLGARLEGVRFRLVADGRTFTPEVMGTTGLNRWEADGVVIEITERQTVDGSWDVVLEASGVDLVEEVCLLDHRVDPAPDSVHEHRWWDFWGMQRSTAVFARGADRGFFACYANPFGVAMSDGDRIRLSYRPAQRYGGRFVSDPLVVGPFTATGRRVRRESLPGRDTVSGESAGYTTLLGPVPAELDAGEIEAVRAAVAARVPWEPARARVAGWDWGANLFRLPVAELDARDSYRRLSALAADMGVKELLVAPLTHPGEDRVADGPWQSIMFLGSGLELHRDAWQPGDEPDGVGEVVDALHANGLRPLAYANPQILWSREEAWAVQPDWEALGQRSAGDAEWVYRWTCLAVPEARAHALERIRAFRDHHELSGLSYDFIYWAPCTHTGHGHLPGMDSQYAQWDGFRQLLRELAASAVGDQWVEVLIGSQQLMPWGAADFTHPHPALGDNQPQWMPAWPDLSLDRVNANYQRRVAYWLRNFAFTPTYKIPGLVGHQANRERFAEIERGWDWEGARFNLLSAIASAPSSLVFCFLPAWDEAEWKAVREHEAPFFRRWIDFAEEHAAVLAGLTDLFDEPRPGAVDGTIARAEDGSGFVFLANPDYVPLEALVPADLLAGAALRELHPVEGRWWDRRVTVDPHEITVLAIDPSPPVPRLVGAAGTVGADGSVVAATGAPGTVVHAQALAADGSSAAVDLRFADDGVQPTLGPWRLAGDVRSTEWTPGPRLLDLLASLAPPVAYTGDEMLQPGTDPSRLRLYVDLLDPSAATVGCRVDGTEVEVRQAYVGSFADVTDLEVMKVPHNLMGHYVDLHDLLEAETDLTRPWRIEVSLGGADPKSFRGVHVAHLPRRDTDEFTVLHDTTQEARDE